MPKFFAISTTHKVETLEESLFDATSNWEESNEPNYRLRKLLQEETIVMKKYIESAMQEDGVMT